MAKSKERQKEKPKGGRASIQRSYLRREITRRMLELGVSMADLAERAGLDMPRSTVYRFLNGESDAYSQNVEAMMRALGLYVTSGNEEPDWIRKLFSSNRQIDRTKRKDHKR